MEGINKGLQGYIEGDILPLYQHFDQAHGSGHVRQVIGNSLALLPVARELYGEVDADMVYTVAAYHDTGLQYGRENHGVASGRYLLQTRTCGSGLRRGSWRPCGTLWRITGLRPGGSPVACMGVSSAKPTGILTRCASCGGPWSMGLPCIRR